MKLTTCILTLNNQITISECLDSLNGLNTNTLVLDAGSTDKTKSLCKQKGVKVQDVSLRGDFSAAKNSLIEQVKNEWIFFLEPWERLVTGHDLIKECTSFAPASYGMQILQSGMITKQLRLWHTSKKIKFSYPVYETILDKPDHYIGGVICSSGSPDLIEKDKFIRDWMARRPTAPEPYYYLACSHLACGRYEDFIKVAEHYLFMEKSGISAVMTRYHIAIIQCYLKKQTQQAVGNILSCIAVNPTMAEFWCLLGDAYYKAKNYQKAEVFYDNAIVLGSRRMSNSEWPIEISKYREYPMKMIVSCREIISESKQITQI